MVQMATRGRKEKFLECLQLHVDTSSNKDSLVFNISCDVDDNSMNTHKTRSDILSIYKNCFINFNRNSTKVDAINANIDEREFDILVNSSDDMNPQVSGWDEKIRKGFDEYFPNYDGVLHYNDGHAGQNLNTLCIMGKKYYNRFGYVYWPEYKSFFCDNEFTEISQRLKKVVYIDQILFLHDHICIPGSKNHAEYEQHDETYKRATMHVEHDTNLWEKRLGQNFGMKYSQ